MVWEASRLHISTHLSLPACTTKTFSSPEEASDTSISITGSLRSFVLFYLIVVLIGFSLSQACNDSGVSCFYKTRAASPSVTQLLLCLANQAHAKPCSTACFLLVEACSSIPTHLGRQHWHTTDRSLMVTSGHFQSSNSAHHNFPGVQDLLRQQRVLNTHLGVITTRKLVECLLEESSKGRKP